MTAIFVTEVQILELEQAALQWARQLDENSLRREVKNLVDHCQAVIDARGFYVTY